MAQLERESYLKHTGAESVKNQKMQMQSTDAEDFQMRQNPDTS